MVRRILGLFALALLPGCINPFGILDQPATVDFENMSGVHEFKALDHYPELWADIEKCSGLKSDFKSMRWFEATEEDDVRRFVRWGDGTGKAAIADPVRRKVLFARGDSLILGLFGGYKWWDDVVRHEMLHIMLGQPRIGEDVHPPKYFNKETGLCKGLIT